MKVFRVEELPRDRLNVKKPWEESFLPPLTVSELWGGAMWNAFKAADMAFDIGANRRLTTFQSLFVKGGLYPEGGLFFQLGKEELYFPSIEDFHKWIAENLEHGMPTYVKRGNEVVALLARVENMLLVLSKRGGFAIEGDWSHLNTIQTKDLDTVSLLEGPTNLFIKFGEGAYPYRTDTGF
ncbi:MAG: hypothetical protein GXN92_02910 [Candidatus Micrarchaeota archaeon]|nr:hypothetical protein [Candidatus Micrarchaeota archaeon]